MGVLDYCQHGAIQLTCPACRGARTLPPAVTQPAQVRTLKFDPMGLTPAEMQTIPDIPDEGEIGPVKIDLSDIVTRASSRVADSSHRSNAYQAPPVKETPQPE